MRSLTFQQVLLVAIIVLIPLLNLVGRWLRGRMQGAAPAPPAPEAAERPLRFPPGARRLEHVPPAERPRSAALPPPSDRRPRRPAPLGGLPEIRRAVVMMTILGSCRALEEPPPARRPTRPPVQPLPRRGG